ARALDARPAVEALADRAVAAVVVEAPVRLEPRALERSVVALGEAGGAPDAFQAELPLVDLDLPAQLLVLGRVTRTGAGWDSGQVTDPAWVRLDVPLLARGYATTVLLPATAPPDAVGRLVQALLARAPEVGPARALMDAVEAERAAAPQLALATLVGSPGLDAAGTKAYAEVQVRAARTRAIALLNQNQVEEAVPAFERWIRMQLVANDTKYLVTAFKALVAVLERRLANPDFARAAETQEWLLRVLEESKAAPGEVADATIDLAYLYSRAHDNAKAEATFERIITQLTAAGDAVRVGRAWYKYGLYHREALRYEQAAEALERAISIWVRAGQYDKKEIPADPARALREVGEIYLNRLSDPVRAKRAYERALRYADGAERRVGVVIDLVRVARRRGDFQVASQLADQAQGEAAAKKLEDLELSALIEAANVAWYQGDYRRGAALCQESLTKVDRLLKALKKPQAPSTLSDQRQLLRRRIYALSVCGLVSMSQRDEEQALEYLQQALRTSQSIGDERETATQLNNLGRVYLEFGRVRPSVESFQRARAIDERLEDRYALAYDLRNLGRALLLQGRYDESEQALTTALTYAQEVRDTNNELRARFALGELYAARDRPEEAAATWQAALPLAEALDVKELSWQIHRALAARARAEGRLADAETSLLEAVRIARSITGRAASSALSPDRTAPFDDLARLYLDTDKAEAAFLVVDQARLLAQLELLDDARIPFRDPAVPGLLGRLRAASTASTAEALGAALRAADPRVGALVRREAASSLAARLPEGTAILAYRITEGALLGFLVDGRGLKVAQAEVPAADLAALIQDYSSRLEARADLATVSARLGELLLAPFAGRLSGTRRVAVVAQGALRYVAFPALPLGEGLLVDQASVIQALDPAAAADALAAPLGPLAARPLIALGGAPSNEAPLPFADRELTVMQEELPQVVLVRGAGADRKRLLDSLGAARGVWHFAGHADLARAATDPLGGVLLASDGPVGMLELLARRTEAELVVLSACRTRLGGRDPDLDGSDLLSLAEVLHLAGAGHVLATTLRVEDVAAALVMKRFYRAARDVPAAEALQAAQQAVRARYPHPAWWAGFTLSAGR
ncbi:MAG: CHAT domain-containing protein, partial [Myxococcales bacterium]|nr:CHAT domain-containing protein [Myxococcales bacterium]